MRADVTGEVETQPSPTTTGDAGGPRPRARVCCVGGGKGGTGKSIVAANLARQLAGRGAKVVLADFDFGGANLHQLVQVGMPEQCLRDFLGGRVAGLEQLLVRAESVGAWLLPGGDEVAGLSQLGFQRKQKLIRHVARLDADWVVCDLGGNSSLDTLDMFNQADRGFLVVSAEPTAIQNAYGFLKAALLRRLLRATTADSAARHLLDRLWDPSGEDVRLSIPEVLERIRGTAAEVSGSLAEDLALVRVDLVVNMASPEEARRVHGSFSAVARRFLSIPIGLAGWVGVSSKIRAAVSRGDLPRVEEDLVSTWLRADSAGEDLAAAAIEGEEPELVMGMNEEVRVGQEILHVQTEDLGREASAYLALVYQGGRVLVSRRLSWSHPFFAGVTSTRRQERVRFLHRTLVQAIRAGKISPQAAPREAGDPAVGKEHGDVESAQG
jgi:flagellar biosynthesis protein FlhG